MTAKHKHCTACRRAFAEARALYDGVRQILLFYKVPTELEEQAIAVGGAHADLMDAERSRDFGRAKDACARYERARQDFLHARDQYDAEHPDWDIGSRERLCKAHRGAQAQGPVITTAMNDGCIPPISIADFIAPLERDKGSS